MAGVVEEPDFIDTGPFRIGEAGSSHAEIAHGSGELHRLWFMETFAGGQCVPFFGVVTPLDDKFIGAIDEFPIDLDSAELHFAAQVEHQPLVPAGARGAPTGVGVVIEGVFR